MTDEEMAEMQDTMDYSTFTFRNPNELLNQKYKAIFKQGFLKHTNITMPEQM